MSSVSNWRSPKVVKILLRHGIEAAKKASAENSEALAGQVMLGVGLHVIPDDLERAAEEALADILAVKEILDFADNFVPLQAFGAVTDRLYGQLLMQGPEDFNTTIAEMSAAVRGSLPVNCNPLLETTRVSCQAQRLLEVIVSALKSRRRE